MAGVIETIKSRRTTRQFTGEAVPPETIRQILDAAVWAPNHHLTEPWEFIVVTGAARERFAEIRVATQAARYPDPSRPEIEAALRKLRDDTLAIPVLIFVTTTVPDDPAVREEDYAATMMAVQNLMLAAAEEGLGTAIKTTGFVGNEALYEWLSVREGRRLAAVVFLGHPAAQAAKSRTPAEAKTRWIS